MTDYLQLLVTTLYQINFIEPNAYQRFIDIDVVMLNNYCFRDIILH